jgi:hypothetical protein
MSKSVAVDSADHLEHARVPYEEVEEAAAPGGSR